MLLCILILGAGGSFVAINIYNTYHKTPAPIPAPAPVPAHTSRSVEPSPFVTAQTPTGLSTGEVNQILTFSTSADTNVAGSLEYRFDWGDDSYSNWSSLPSASHSWSSPSTYTIRARARLVTGALTSEWSAGVTVTIAEAFTLSTSENPQGSGTVSRSPDKPYYDSGERVTLTATPAPGYRFSHWSGDVSSTGSTFTITMDRDMSITANFVRQFTLSTPVNPSGGGTISRSPDKPYYDSGERVTLTATPASGYRFSHWSGDVSSTASTSTVTMDRDKSVVANFVRQFTLSTSVIPTGSGTVNPSSDSYDSSTGVTLTAMPASDYYEFDYWSGDTSGTSQTITITMDSNKSVVANFKKRYQPSQYTMPPGAIGGSTVTYSKTLKAGETVDGSVQLTGQYYSVDWSYNWTFQILGPGGESIQQWTGHWVNNNYHEFSFTASYAGTYKIRVYHASSYSKNLTIEIWPPGWGYSGS